MKPGVAFAVIIVLATGVASQYPCSVSLEAENGSGGRPKPRGHASGEQSVLLFLKEKLTFYLLYHVLDNFCELSSFNITYSNDGASDTFTVSLNGSFLGGAQTLAQSKQGEYWDLFRTVKVPIKEVVMYEGQYSIIISVTKADDYGVEVDKCTLQFECSHKISDGSACPVDAFAEMTYEFEDVGPGIYGVDPGDNGDSGDDESLSTIEITAIATAVIGALGVLVGVPSCIYAIILCRRHGYNLLRNNV